MDIPIGTGVNTDNPGLIGQRFFFLGIIIADQWIDDSTCDEIDMVDLLAVRQRFGNIYNIFGLSASIGIAAKLQGTTAN
jgi:hypothetical protein